MTAKFRDQINAKARMMLVVPPTVICPLLPLTPSNLLEMRDGLFAGRWVEVYPTLTKDSSKFQEAKPMMFWEMAQIRNENVFRSVNVELGALEGAIGHATSRRTRS